jgi:hypothetical protein
MAFTIFRAFQQHIDDIAGLHGYLSALVEKFVDGNDSLGLVTDINDDFAVGHFQNRALDDFAFCYIPEAVIVKVQKAGVFLRIYVGIVSVPGSSRFERLPTRLLAGGRGALRLDSRVLLVLRHDH